MLGETKLLEDLIPVLIKFISQCFILPSYDDYEIASLIVSLFTIATAFPLAMLSAIMFSSLHPVFLVLNKKNYK